MKLYLTAFIICIASISAFGQKVALKTNLIDDALMDINLGAEVGVAPKWTIDVPVSFNAWNISRDRKWKHWIVQPGVRYWFCDRFSGHFVGAHLCGGQYNLGGAGVSYGYAWILDRHWNIEGEI